MNATDLKTLQVPLVVLALILLAAAGGIYYTNVLQEQAHQRLATQQKRLKDAQTQLQQSGDEKQVIETFLDGYQQLARAGFMGDEQRINWLDGLRVANQRADLFGVDYQISAQKPYPFAAELNPGQLTMSESAMTLRFRLLHEEDLMRFFGALAQTGAGVFEMNECTLRRVDTGGVIRVEPHIEATCELSWITARAPRHVEAKP